MFNNGNDGIWIAAGASLRNCFIANSLCANGDQSIDLGDNVITPNDPGDGDTGTNNLQNFPVITSVVDVGGALEVTYRVDSATSNSAYPLNIDVYLNSNGQREGYRAFEDVYNQAPNTLRSFTFTPGISGGHVLLMARDAQNNSSELGAAVSFTVSPPPDQIFNDRFESP